MKRKQNVQKRQKPFQNLCEVALLWRTLSANCCIFAILLYIFFALLLSNSKYNRISIVFHNFTCCLNTNIFFFIRFCLCFHFSIIQMVFYVHVVYWYVVVTFKRLFLVFSKKNSFFCVLHSATIKIKLHTRWEHFFSATRPDHFSMWFFRFFFLFLKITLLLSLLL